MIRVGARVSFDKLKISRLIECFYQRNLQKGVRLVRGSDFHQLERGLSEVTEKMHLTEHFRRSLNTYTPANAFWLAGYNEENKLISVAAARLDQLGEWDLARYWGEYWPRCYPGADNKPVQLDEFQYRYTSEISGNVVYLGEMWVDSGHLEKNVAGEYSKALMLLCILEWEFEWLYAWSRPSYLDRGFAHKCGFARVWPGIRWKQGPSTIDQDLKVMANSRSDLIDLVDALAFELLAEANNKKSSEDRYLR